jgi:hypothetical protein
MISNKGKSVGCNSMLLHSDWEDYVKHNKLSKANAIGIYGIRLPFGITNGERVM